MPRGSIPTEKEIEEIRRLHKEGYSFRKIADQLGRSYQFVKKYVEEEPRKPLDLTGRVFGRLTVIKFDHKKNKVRYWLCRCQCGNTHIASTSNLTGKITRSCGCLKKDYNKSRSITIKDKGSKKKKIRQVEEVVLKEDYRSEKKYGKVKEYKLSPEELAAYLKELGTKKVKKRGE